MAFSQDLRRGVHLTVVPSQKFKTVSAAVNFIAPLELNTLTERQLIANLWPVANAQYPDPRQLTMALQDLYGASLRTGVDREGALSIVSAQLQFLSDRTLPAGESLLPQALALLQSIVWQPLLQQGDYAPSFFKPERDNLDHELRSVMDSADNAAVLTAQKQYFQHAPEQAALLAGTPATIAAANAAQLAAYWTHMQDTDQIEIVITGDVDPQQAAAIVNAWSIAPRPIVPTPIQWTGKLPHLRQWQVAAPFQQSQLIMMYHLPVTYYGPKYFDYMVTDALFGGSASSLLFAAVREQASLAYYAGTDLDAQTGTTLLQAGIDPGTADQVRAIVAQTLEQLQTGDFTDVRLHSIQEELIGIRLGEADRQSDVNSRALLQRRLPDADMTTTTFTQGIQNVTREQVAACAKQYQLVVDFLQEGASHDD
ncbi:EF-P 5-aminopentanol modification-associated protein YfmF [Schleiferilactobacillus perolens]|jgi:predicted Zn-dependent peptidase|uniref:EF-P 5-aminopentanol modification-associated protein YfmF n=1 Tax=Schleiferilactobacillus perolens TaxID=100468 RepID=UPI002357B243|nr:insulinase family protein [Schleiferilactobacillus perolens]MCI2170255.1 insulinase family protein [Schleiferilactobacillus perolens]